MESATGDGLADAMKNIERTSTIISREMSEEKGVTAQSNRELQAFLKDKTSGIAGAIVRGNKDAIGLETWRLLWAEFSPQTLTSTMRSQQLEKFPKPAKNMSEMSKRLLDWERDLRRCSEEGRSLPSEEEKRLALLRLLPGPQRKALWDTADQLFPSFTSLLSKVHKMIQEEHDAQLGFGPMELDNVDDDGDGWKPTGQILTGKGANGEEALFALQRRGDALRVAPKGGKKGGGKGNRKGDSRDAPATGKGVTEWDPDGCARCGRSTHWARECKATKDVLGNEPRNKPPKKAGRKGGRRL